MAKGKRKKDKQYNGQKKTTKGHSIMIKGKTRKRTNSIMAKGKTTKGQTI
jgi:formylmethanofuran dehydrogenase subunit C